MENKLKREIINQAKLLLAQLNESNYSLKNVAYWITKHNDLYKLTKVYSESLCQQCKEWEELGLPYDCLQNPDYCMRKPIYFEFINTYEEIQQRITTLQN